MVYPTSKYIPLRLAKEEKFFWLFSGQIFFSFASRL
jgi:hypothetical protein